MDFRGNSAPVLGRDVLVEVDLADSETAPVWLPLSLEVDSTLTRSHAVTDRRVKADQGAPSKAATSFDWSVSCSGKFDRIGVIPKKLADQFRAATWSILGRKIHLRLISLDGSVESGWAVLETWEKSNPSDDDATYSASFQGDGWLN